MAELLIQQIFQAPLSP